MRYEPACVVDVVLQAAAAGADEVWWKPAAQVPQDGAVCQPAEGRWVPLAEAE